MVEALSHESVQGRCCRLEELDLRDNRLGIPSLKALTTIVDCASHDLRDLDLSGNCIHIHTNDDAAVWQRFLASFEQCCLLRRLDLSGNSLGPRGFEVLFRVYAKESPLDLLWPSGFVDGQDEVSVEYSLRNMSLVPEFNETVGNIANGQHPSKCKGSKYGLLIVIYYVQFAKVISRFTSTRKDQQCSRAGKILAILFYSARASICTIYSTMRYRYDGCLCSISVLHHRGTSHASGAPHACTACKSRTTNTADNSI